MSEQKASLISLLIILFFCFGLPILEAVYYAFEDAAIPNPFDYARITDVEYKAVLLDEPTSRGTAQITERLTFDIHALSKSNPFWELWRDLCEDKIDGLNIKYNVKSVKQIMPDGTKVIYGESPRLYWEDYDYVEQNPTLRTWKMVS